MAASVPASLKSADITRFAHRAAQLEKAKPIVAYWCDYWIVNQILSKGLHNVDQDSLAYTTTMMDKLEKFKSQHAEESAVVDDTAGKAYVEQFGLETFARADNAIRADSATRQTADTFQAAATFLDLLAIWGPIDTEIISKIKFGKYHAIRILKAIQAGEDPNASNPKPVEAEALPELDPNDAEVQALERGGRPRQPSVVEVPDEADRIQHNLAKTSSIDESLHPSRDPSAAPKPRQPSVIEVPDDAHRLQANLAGTSTQNESLHPSRAPSIPPSATEGVSPIEQDPSNFYSSSNANDAPVSPLDPPAPPQRKPSVGGNYFPETPSSLNTQPPNSATDPFPSVLSKMGPPPPSQPQHPNAPPPSSAAAPFSPPIPPPPTAPQTQHFAPPPPAQPLAPPAFHPPAASYYTQPTAPPTKAHVDEEAMLSAQKHCRWAISALNFEDVPTAIKELRGALGDLGGL